MSGHITRVADVALKPGVGDPRDRDRLLRVTVVCAGTASIVYMCLTAGWLPPLVVLLLGALAVVLPPSAPTLARRAAINGSVVVGWFPLLWWVEWPIRVNHGALMVSVGLAISAGCLVAGPGARTTLRPRVAGVDVLVPVSGVFAVAAMSRWAFPSSPAAAMAVMLPGADNYPHFYMSATMREHGAILDALGNAPDGSPWAFFNYPQGFHALVASAMEVALPHTTLGAALLTAYTRGETLVVVSGAMMLTAAIVSIPELRTRAAITVPVVTVTMVAYLWEPGQNALNDGFANFWIGALAIATAHLLAMSTKQPLAAAETVAVGGLVVAAANAWAPLSVFGVPAVAALLMGVRRHHMTRRALACAIVTSVLAGTAAWRIAILLFRTVPVEYVVTTQTGGLHSSSPLPTLYLVGLGASVCLLTPAWYRRWAVVTDQAKARRIQMLGVTVVGGFLGLALFFAAQMALIGTLAYYFLKLHVGFELILAGFVPALCGTVLATVVPVQRCRKRVVLATVVTVAATQAFGLFPGGPGALHTSKRQDEGTAALDASYSRIGIAKGVLRAVHATRGQNTFDIDYFPIGRARAANPFFPDGWFHAVQHSLSLRVFDRYAIWRHGSHGINDAAEFIRSMLLDDPNVRVLVDDPYVEPLRRRLGDPRLGVRVVGMSSLG